MTLRGAGTWCGSVLLCAAPLAAQRGDRAGEEQPGLPPDLAVLPAPALSPADELATFAFPDDVAVELVAAEPLVRDPIALAFDAQGALWVVEMTGYMPDLDGKGEREPVGSIAILRDLDGDGRFEKRTTFLDRLVLPRAVRPCRGGALVLAPPELLFCSDEDGDDVCDERVVVDRGLEGLESPEWAINGLVPTLDNAFDCAKAPWRYVWRDGGFVRESRQQAGQWGASQDDQGRLFTDNNSDPLRADFVNAVYGGRNPNLGGLQGVDVRVVDDFAVKSARHNPGVNRGYQKGVLDAAFHLANVTGACAPWIARGAGLPERYRGDAFVCEPCGNVVIDYDLVEQSDGSVRGAPVRFGERGLDFLASTDERFRPVFACDGPDGALYVADMYRGLIQHKLFVTSFLRGQVVERGLDRPIGLGRIWRIAAKRHAPPRPAFADASDAELVSALADPNGWRRDTAQRLIVESFDARTPELKSLERLALRGEPWFGRVHALWALAGLGALSGETATRAMQDADERVRVQAVRASEALASRDPLVPAMWRVLATRDGFRVRRQVFLSLGSLSGDALASYAAVGERGFPTAAERSALVSGLYGRELEFLEVLCGPRASAPRDGEVELAELLARCIANELVPERVERAAAVAVRLATTPHGPAIARGLLAAVPPDAQGGRGRFVLPGEPAGWSTFVATRTSSAGATEPDASGAPGVSGTPTVAGAADAASPWRELDQALAWPGKPGVTLEPVRPLASDELARFERGRELFAATCVACHGESGAGQPNVVPPLRASPFVLGDETRLVRIVTHGLTGPIEVRGQQFDGEMPGFATRDDELAAILTYVRRAWSHGAEPLTPERVAA
ncbi:MAG: c-type cytochrome, partial [Planctomycetes bacterium]|nr:c-type cytochrome [Planctomycetota bacterium]